MSSAHARFIAAALLLTCTALFLEAHPRNEMIPPRTLLTSFPARVGNWVGADVPVDRATLDVLGPGDFLLRTYKQIDAAQSVDLFLAYFPSQRTGDTVHSPRNCLPGAGWVPVHNERIMLDVPGAEPFLANQYVIQRGMDRELVVYWYLSHNRAVASEYLAKIYLVLDSMRLNRSDGSLVRFTTPMLAGDSPASATARIDPFVREVTSQLPQYIPN